jgi:hypothetical protein
LVSDIQEETKTEGIWVLRGILRLKRDEVTGGWIKLHNEMLHDLYSSSSIIRMIKSRTMRWAGDVARIE